VVRLIIFTYGVKILNKATKRNLFMADAPVTGPAPAFQIPEIPACIAGWLEAADYDSIDSGFLTRLDQNPVDTDFLVGTLRGVVKRKRTRQAREHLDLLVQALNKKENTAARGTVGRQILKFWPDCQEARAMVLAHLRSVYAESPNISRLIGHCTFSGDADSLKTLDTLESWLRFDEGCPVYMQTKGVGRVREVNLAIGTVKVVFDGEAGKPMSFRITEAARLLEPLAKGHFLRDKLDNLSLLQQLADSDPGELLRRIFTSLNRPLSAADLKDLLSGVIPAQAWSSWWNRAKQDPRIVAGSGARALCSWSDSAQQADAMVGDAFAKAAPRQKLEMAKKYLGRSEDIGKIIVESLASIACNAQKNEPGFALEIALTLESKMPASLRSLFTVTSSSLIERPDIIAIIDQIEDKALRRKVVSMIREQRSDWIELYFTLLRQEGDTQSIEMVYEALCGGDRARLDDMVKSVMMAPLSAQGFFTWMCRVLPDRPELKARADVSLIKAVIGALSDSSFSEFHSQLRKMFDSGQACRLAVGNLDMEQAREILAVFDRDVGLESFRKDEFLRDLDTTFPGLNKPEHEIFYVTSAALEAKQEEFRRIVQHDLPGNRDEIVKAKEFGDLKENFEYHAARARQEMLSSRAKTLGDQLSFARIIKNGEVDFSQVNVGTSVRLVPSAGAGEEITLTILGPWDSDPSRNILSHLAPAAIELLGAKTGDTREYHGTIFRIADIRPWTK
jgi:transcription elongation GreA/GreB family factor